MEKKWEGLRQRRAGQGKCWESLVWTLGLPATAPSGMERAGPGSPGATSLRGPEAGGTTQRGSGSRGELAFSPGCSQADVSLARRPLRTLSARMAEAKLKERDRDGERQLCFQATPLKEGGPQLSCQPAGSRGSRAPRQKYGHCRQDRAFSCGQVGVRLLSRGAREEAHSVFSPSALLPLRPCPRL